MTEQGKIKILFIITQGDWGGAQQFIYKLITGLDQNRFDIHLGIGNDHFEDLNTKLSNTVPVFLLSSLRRSPNPWHDVQNIIEIRNKIDELKPNIVFLNSSKAGFNGALANYLSTTKAKVVYRIGGWTFNDPWSWWMRFFYFALERISAPLKDYIIVNSTKDLLQAKNLGIKPRREMRCIHNGIDIHSFTFLEKEKAQIELLGAHTQDLVIGTIANFYPAKGLTYLIEAMHMLNIRHIPAHRLVIIGDGAQRKELESLIMQYKLEKIVSLVGKRDNAYQYLKAFDIFVLPSAKEGFPWTLLEAMSAQLPIITTRVGATSEIIEHNQNGIIITPKDVQALADTIEHLLVDKTKRETLGLQALRRVQSSFSLDAMIKHYAKIFEDLVA